MVFPEMLEIQVSPDSAILLLGVTEGNETTTLKKHMNLTLIGPLATTARQNLPRWTLTVSGETNHGECKQCKTIQPERRNLPYAAIWAELEDIRQITSGALHYKA